MKKKTTIFIRDGEVRNYQDPLRRLAPVEKISSTDNHRETPSSSRGRVPRQRTVYSQRLIFRLKMAFLSILFSVFALIVMLWEVLRLSQFSIILIIMSAYAITSNYFFSRLFFLEIGKSSTERRRLKASRGILYVIFCGLSVLSFISDRAVVIFYDGNESLIKGNYIQIMDNLKGALSEDSAAAVTLVVLVSFVVWVLAVVIAIINKIIVNAHNQE